MTIYKYREFEGQCGSKFEIFSHYQKKGQKKPSGVCIEKKAWFSHLSSKILYQSYFPFLPYVSTIQLYFLSKDRARQERKRKLTNYIIANYTENSTMVTLTFSEPVSDLDIFQNKIKNFFRRLIYNYIGFRKYIYFPERHLSGALHCHILFFDCPYIHF